MVSAKVSEPAKRVPDVWMIPAASELDPLPQGGLDGLCGVYSIINALRVARHACLPLPGREARRLFGAALHYLNEEEDLPEVVRFGMDHPTWIALAKDLATRASTESVKAVVKVARKPVSPKQRHAWIISELAQGHPVLVHLPGYCHYSVIVGWASSGFQLFDSHARKRVQAAPMSVAISLSATSLVEAGQREPAGGVV
jgi:hypothetical protein